MKQTSLSFLFSLLFFALAGNAQVIIKGKITDLKSNPVSFANVYLDNSSFGTQAAENGEYSLNIPPGIKGELIASSVGFISEKKVINSSDIIGEINFALQTKMLEEVQVLAKRKGKAKKLWNIFRKGFLGQTWAAAKAEILNSQVIQIKEEGNNVIAVASEPIIVRNETLGYTVTVEMNQFKSDGITTYMSAKKRFEKLEPIDAKQEEKWKKNREQIFNTSLKKYLYQLSQGISNKDFKTYKLAKRITSIEKATIMTYEMEKGFASEPKTSELVRKIEGNQFAIQSDQPLVIFTTDLYNQRSIFTDLPYKFTQLILTNGFAVFDSYGWVTYPNEMLLLGVWGNEGIADVLPREYLPTEATASNDITLQAIEKISPNSLVDNSINLTFDRNIVYETSEIEVQNIKEDDRFTADYIYELKERDQDLSILSIIRRMPGVRIMSQPNGSGMEEYSIVISGGNDRPALLFVDGIAYESSRAFGVLQQINSRDIEKIALVKTNLGYFGVRGGAGVIAIYTKSTSD